MYLSRIRPKKPKFVEEEAIKAEFIPIDPVVKESKDYDSLSYTELRKLIKEKGIVTKGNPKKDELIKLLGGEDVEQD